MVPGLAPRGAGYYHTGGGYIPDGRPPNLQTARRRAQRERAQTAAEVPDVPAANMQAQVHVSPAQFPETSAHCVAYSITVPLPPASDHGVNALTAPQVPTAQLVQPNAQLLAPGMDVPMQHISLLEASALTPPHISTEQIVESNARLIVHLSHFL